MKFSISTIEKIINISNNLIEQKKFFDSLNNESLSSIEIKNTHKNEESDFSIKTNSRELIGVISEYTEKKILNLEKGLISTFEKNIK